MSPTTVDMYVSDYTGIAGTYFFHSADNGETWNYLWGMDDNFRPITLLVDRDDPSVLYATEDRVYRSIDGGMNWTTDGRSFTWNLITIIQDQVLPNRMFLQGHRIPSTSDVTALIYLSFDRGTTWQYDSSSQFLPNVYNIGNIQRNNIHYDSQRQRLYIGTTKGIYVKDYGVTYVENPMSVPSDQLLCYPQPARQYIAFLYMNHHKSRQTVLRIINVLGKQVHEQRVEPSSMYVWNLLDSFGVPVPDGLYWVTATSTEGVRTKTFIINRH